MEEQPITLTFEFTRAESRRVIWQLTGSRKAKRAILGWVLAIVLGVVLYLVIHGGKSAYSPPAGPSHRALGTPPSRDDFFGDFLIPFLPWLLVFFFIWFFLLLAVRKRARTQIAGQQRTYVFGPEGITVDMLYTRTESQWQIIQKFVETKQFFLLKTGPRAGHVIPKRVFRDAAEMDRFRNMVQQHLDVPTARHAFPVTIRTPPPGNT